MARIFGLTICLLCCLSQPAWAIDGVLEINQVCAEQTGCFAGDGPGFPVTISEPGSYVLTSSLAIAPVDVDGIEVTAPDASRVSIDANGFEIAGPVVCSGSGSTLSCAPASTGRGIRDTANAPEIFVRDGRVRGFLNGVEASVIEHVISHSNAGTGLIGLRVAESIAFSNGKGITGSSVENCVADQNKSSGIRSDRLAYGNVSYANGAQGIEVNRGVARGNSAYLNEGDGIYNIDLTGSLIADNVAFSNGGDGIDTSALEPLGESASVQGNVARGNAEVGIDMIFGLAPNKGVYRENTVSSNTQGTVTGGYNLGANSCSGNPTCP